MPAEKFTTKLIARELKVIHNGTTRKNTPYTIWQVIATQPDGTPITEHNLRSFAELPLNEVIEVEAELFRSEEYGESYTLKQKGVQGGQTKQRVEAVEERVTRIEQHLGLATEESPADTPPPTDTSSPDPPADMPPPPVEVATPADADPGPDLPPTELEPDPAGDDRWGSDPPF